MILSSIAMPGAAAAQNRVIMDDSHRENVKTTHTVVIINGKELQNEKKVSKSFETITTRPLFPGATPGHMYMHKDGRCLLAITTASVDNGVVKGRVSLAGMERERCGELMVYRHAVRIEIIDGGNVVGEWKNPGPEISDAGFIDYVIGYSGRLGPKAYLDLYVDDVPEYRKVIREKKAPSCHAIGNIRPDGTGIDNVTLVLDKKSFPGYSGMFDMSIMTDGGQYIADPDIHLIAYFDSESAVYERTIPFTRPIQAGTDPVYIETGIVLSE